MEKASFKLETSSGSVSFTPTETSDYTEFMVNLMNMVLAFNSHELEPTFCKIMKTALYAYSNGEEFEEDVELHPDVHRSEYETEFDEKEDLIFLELEEISNLSKEIERATKKIKELPKDQDLKFQILSLEEEVMPHVRALLASACSKSELEVEPLYLQAEPFVLSYNEGVKLYASLRNHNCYVSIIPDEQASLKPTDIKKMSALRRSSLTQYKDITGKEKLPNGIGKIS